MKNCWLGISPPPERYPIAYPKSENVNVNINLKKNKNEKNEAPSSLPYLIIIHRIKKKEG